MKRCVLCFVLVAFSSICHAVPQIGDTLEDGSGKKKFVYDFVLSLDQRARLEEWKYQNVSVPVVSPSNLDGFYADLVLKDGHLYLTRLQIDAKIPGKGLTRLEIPLDVLFVGEGPIPATWFTGELRIYHGSGTGYSHIRSKATVISFQKGIHQSTEEIEVGG